MDEQLHRIASLANEMAYASKDSKAYINGAPHIKHAALRRLYGQLVLKVFAVAQKQNPAPVVLDLGAGEGSVTLPFLELGARVVAVDLASRQLEALKKRCERYGDMLEVRCEDINDTLADESRRYDIIAANSFLHHVPDYLSLIKNAVRLLNPEGIFFSFQDPLRYDSTSAFTRLFTDAAYISWRLSLGRNADLIGGFKRRMRRRRGIYLADCMEDNAEYHITRNGVDQDAIRDALAELGFDCELVTYFSTASRLFQPIGTAIGVKNMFAVIARNRRGAKRSKSNN